MQQLYLSMQFQLVDVQLTMVAVRYFAFLFLIMKEKEPGHSVVVPQA